MPAPAATASLVALDLMQREPERVKRLQSRSLRFRDGAKAAGFTTGDSWGYGIVPIIIGDTVATLKLSERLLCAGINAFPILPPGVPEKTSRLRFFHQREPHRRTVDLAVSTLTREWRSSAMCR